MSAADSERASCCIRQNNIIYYVKYKCATSLQCYKFLLCSLVELHVQYVFFVSQSIFD